MSMETPYKRVEGLGAAKSGTGHFIQQRVTAVFNIPSVLFLILFVASHIAAPRAQLMANLQSPWLALPLILALASIFWHMRLGMQTIIEDYVHTHISKYALLILSTVYAAALFALSLYAILKMSFAS